MQVQNEQQRSTKSATDTAVSGPKASSQERILKKRGYNLGKLLGEGSYAKVYYAEYEDQKTRKKQKLACKLINGSSAPKDFLQKFFPREIEIMSKVIHQNIIRVHSILQRKQKFYIFMQYAQHGDLLEYIRLNGPVRENHAHYWFGQIIKGLKYLHDRDIAHRDMKCENLLLTSNQNIKISDFGFARYTVNEQGKSIWSDTFCGSVSYAPPEIIKGQMYDCKKADLWSIGVILFILLNKSMPFDDSNLKKLYESQRTRNWKVRSRLKDVLSTEVKQFLYVLLEPLPEKRKTLEQIGQNPWMVAEHLGSKPTEASAPQPTDGTTHGAVSVTRDLKYRITDSSTHHRNQGSTDAGKSFSNDLAPENTDASIPGPYPAINEAARSADMVRDGNTLMRSKSMQDVTPQLDKKMSTHDVTLGKSLD